ncbi:MAG: T9SS type A sorting domain-containing protein [Bacteroidaceae bacterium]|nr:T9SS type A sorting domain-containing protein [Bacteroidaceae bacterium]
MKKFMKLTMLSLLMAGGAQAQVATIPEIWQPLDIGLCTLPKAYSTDGKAKLVYYESLEEGGNIKINVCNSSFNVEHSFEVAPQKISSKIVTEIRAAVSTPSGVFRTGEWEVIDEYEYTEEYYLDVIWNSYDLDNDNCSEQALPLLVTQTLFNADAKYEYLRYKYVETHSIEDEADTDGDGIIDKRRVRDESKCVGIEVVSEDGNVLTSFDVENVGSVSSQDLFLWGGKRYINIEVSSDSSDDYSYYYAFYEINPTGNSVTRVSAENFMHILPAMTRKNTTVTVELGEESAKNGGSLVITSMNGRTVYQQMVAPGETSVQVPLRRLSSGAYNVTLLNRGQKVESSKLIIR